MSGPSLTEIFRRLIATSGPISVQQFMGESNARYYAGKDPLGTAGDFVTAPEISQMFGELIGLWLADIWMRAGKPGPVRYVELGPGRGTLARDALRAMGRFGLSPEVHLVESSPALQAIQRAALPQARFHADLGDIPTDAPILLVANEFLDALPIRQLVRIEGGWREMMVAAAEDGFAYAPGPLPMDAAVPQDWREAEPGTVLETCPGAAAVVDEVAGRLVAQGGAALFIDYGHDRFRTGSTLQAVRQHRKVDALAAPGEADLTAHVDFATLAQMAEAGGAKWLGTAPHGAFLRALGIDQRAEALAQVTPGKAEALRQAKDRLTGDDQMGLLFKVMGLAAPGWPDGAGFPPR
ncbi:class I SAM-dependent methyltransferase [Altericroceibacterium xinjiangense]|uniref:class I SAM-dependent methyltransferase n=1 Tax=Altericroceibacterium xinjiangense TaxID=762261 RepID=UPI000F7EBAC6|nr:SAM-dependent methyltransferase [Altericroceibacterium xinjiangense]